MKREKQPFSIASAVRAMSQIHPMLTQKSITQTSFPYFTIVWDDLKYDVIKSRTEMFIEKNILRKNDVQQSKTIFNGLCGEFKCGELNALMGPSGAGKSTLLECLCGKREKGKSGFVGLCGSQKVNVAFIPQHDHFFYLLTVREALMFASKLQNSMEFESNTVPTNPDVTVEPVTDIEGQPNKRPLNYHEKIVESIIDQLSLNVCADTRISNLSGGQQKRLSIAQELVAKPDVLILDEPTSGLDSSSCYQTVELLRKLAEQTPPIAIIATIHQPSAKVFNLFHQVYVLSTIGKCIYNGPPTKIIPWMNDFGLRMPEYYNPADFIIEISYGEFGKECLHQMADAIGLQNENIKQYYANREVKNLQGELFYRDCTYSFEHIRILAHRASIFLLRDPLSFLFRLFIHFTVGLSMGVLFQGMGREGGCPPDLSQGVKLEMVESLKLEIQDAEQVIYNNLGNLFFAMIFAQFQGVVLNVISFPLTIRAIQKEVSNGWYSGFTYFNGFMIAEFPNQLANSWLFATLVYVITQQPFETTRYIQFCVIVLLVSMVAQGHGVVMGLLFGENVTAAVFVAPATAVPHLLFSGFLLKTDDIPYYLKIFSFTSYMRYAMEGAFVAIFGNLRCGEGTGHYVQMAKDQIKLFMHSMFRIVRHAMDEDYEDEDGGMPSLSLNISESLVTGLMPSYLDDAEVDNDGNMVSYVIHEFRLTNNSYYESALILLSIAIGLRVISYFLFNKKVSVSK